MLTCQDALIIIVILCVIAFVVDYFKLCANNNLGFIANIKYQAEARRRLRKMELERIRETSEDKKVNTGIKFDSIIRFKFTELIRASYIYGETIVHHNTNPVCDYSKVITGHVYRHGIMYRSGRVTYRVEFTTLGKLPDMYEGDYQYLTHKVALHDGYKLPELEAPIELIAQYKNLKDDAAEHAAADMEKAVQYICGHIVRPKHD